MHRGQRAPGESSSASDERPVANNRSAVMACADKSCADESCRAARRGHCCRARALAERGVAHAATVHMEDSGGEDDSPTARFWIMVRLTVTAATQLCFERFDTASANLRVWNCLRGAVEAVITTLRLLEASVVATTSTCEQEVVALRGNSNGSSPLERQRARLTLGSTVESAQNQRAALAGPVAPSFMAARAVRRDEQRDKEEACDKHIASDRERLSACRAASTTPEECSANDPP